MSSNEHSSELKAELSRSRYSTAVLSDELAQCDALKRRLEAQITRQKRSETALSDRIAAEAEEKRKAEAERQAKQGQKEKDARDPKLLAKLKKAGLTLEEYDEFEAKAKKVKGGKVDKGPVDAESRLVWRLERAGLTREDYERFEEAHRRRVFDLRE
jgi:anti-sigma factor RsiW